MKKLRRKIVLGVSSSATVVFVLTVLIVSLTLNLGVARRADYMNSIIIQYNGILPPKSEYEKLDENDGIHLFIYSEESPYRLRYFVVNYDQYGHIAEMDTTHSAAVDNQDAAKMANKIINSGKQVGYLDDFRFRISDDRLTVSFINCGDDIYNVNQLNLILLLISALFVLMITAVFWFLSKRIVKPFEENAKMQKQFITDASHELKTPLAIISANAEVLAYKDGESEWIKSITSQVGRMSELVNELLMLNRLEEIEELDNLEQVDLSEKAEGIIDSFCEVFKSKNASVVRKIQSGVILRGSASQLERLISVLTENASKYVSENGEVRFTLNRESKYTVFSVFNTCEIDSAIDYSHLFDRFYRPDSSRTTETGGHGIGLSIAKRIALLHNGSIEAVPSNDGLTFRVKLSNRLK
ncbi:MAG: HAMP domain-containing histidine kinase [Ruminococcus sp.]|nr:HAMP domain-containing histidine kinase [Ruminococcus sp.]